MSLRFAVRSVLAVNPKDRCRGLVRIALKLKELRDGLFPHGWERRRDWPRLRKAILDTRDYGILIDGGRGVWFPWLVRKLPSLDRPDLEETIVVDLELPPGSGKGPIIDLPTLDKLSVESSPRYRAYVAAHSIAWIQGVTQVRNPKSNRWCWTGDLSRYPIVSREDRRRLAFGERDYGNHRMHAQIDDAFKGLPGLVVVDRRALARPTVGDGGYFHVTPPTQ